ncbi:MAG TPA: phosphatidate cytidylyltransferase [Gemmatimonadaceae bacterium]|nr:phosphatidate cytidylyltransferase [Gemmatimonadaceae bacterium]
MSQELTKRILFGVVAAPIAIAILIIGSWPLAGLLAITSAIAASEFNGIARAAGLAPLDIGVTIAGLIPLAVFARYLGIYGPQSSAGPLSIAVLVVLAVFAAGIWARGANGKPLAAVAATVAGVIYTGGTLSYAYAIRYHEYAFAPASLSLGHRAVSLPSGGLLLLLPVLLAWSSDIGAYAFGRMLGRHKLIPSVSPGKTVEGAIGGLVAAMLVAWVYTDTILRPAAHLGFRVAPVGVLVFGALVSAVAQLGDLVESLLKRDAGVKDSSHIIPGHGGVLDRCDSLLFVLPFSYAVLGLMLTWAPS